MSELKELYNDMILFHQGTPRNFRELESANRVADGHNPLCGDQLRVYLLIEDDLVKDISFKGKGCAISIAAASMMTQNVKGKSRQEAETLFNEFHQLLMGNLEGESSDHLGHLKDVFANVHKYPVRVKCATLPWHTMHAALNNQEITSTEGALDPASSAGG